jgi:hypothetical protein
LAPLASVPASLVKDTVLALQVLWRRLARGEQPASGFRVLPTKFGDDSPEGVTRRALLTGGRSITPNTFVVGLDRDTETLAGRAVTAAIVPAGRPRHLSGSSLRSIT